MTGVTSYGEINQSGESGIRSAGRRDTQGVEERNASGGNKSEVQSVHKEDQSDMQQVSEWDSERDFGKQADLQFVPKEVTVEEETAREINSKTNKQTGEIQKQYKLEAPVRGKVSTYFEEALKNQMKPVDKKEWKAAWNEEISKTPEFDTSTMHLLTGTLRPIWDRLPQNVAVLTRRLLRNHFSKASFNGIAPKIQTLGDFIVSGGKTDNFFWRNSWL